VLEALNVAIKHGFGFGDWCKLKQMGQALFLHEFQIDAFGQCSFPEKEGIGMDRLISPDGQEQGADPGEGAIDGAEHRGCGIVPSCPLAR
jgi:hypothetical protein